MRTLEVKLPAPVRAANRRFRALQAAGFTVT